MKPAIDFNMIVHMNALLKERHYEYSVHAIGGCSMCGLHLVQDGQEESLDDIVACLNEYLRAHWIYLKASDDDPYMLYIYSRFDSF